MNTMEVLDIESNKHLCDVIKIIENEKNGKTYIAYKENEDILVSQLIKEKDIYQIKPVLDDEWDFIEKNLY